MIAWNHKLSAATQRGRRGRPEWLATWRVGLWALAIWVSAVSCSSPQGSGQRAFAEVTIAAQSEESIRQAVAEVFEAEGYANSSRGERWSFERRGGAMSQLMHGGWFDQEQVRIRVKLELTPLAGERYRLSAVAVQVRDAGDSFFEEESPMTRLRSNPYQGLLDDVERRLR
jgi:hypothetical protein